VVSILAAAQSVIATTTGAAARNALEDGQFTLARTLTDEERDELADAGVSVEAEPSLDFTVRNAAGTDATLRLLANRTDIDRVDVAAGRAAQGADEALVERRYAEVNGINAGDTLELGGRTLTVVGIGISPDYELCVREPSDAYAEASAFGTIFVTSQTYDELRDAGAASTAETLTYAYRFDASEATLPARDQVTTNADLRVWLRDHVGAALSGFMTAQDNPRVLAAADDVSINVRVSLFAGVIVFVPRCLRDLGVRGAHGGVRGALDRNAACPRRELRAARGGLRASRHADVPGGRHHRHGSGLLGTRHVDNDGHDHGVLLGPQSPDGLRALGRRLRPGHAAGHRARGERRRPEAAPEPAGAGASGRRPRACGRGAVSSPRPVQARGPARARGIRPLLPAGPALP
jgi:hypothetical protein